MILILIYFFLSLFIRQQSHHSMLNKYNKQLVYVRLISKFHRISKKNRTDHHKQLISAFPFFSHLILFSLLCSTLDPLIHYIFIFHHGIESCLSNVTRLLHKSTKLVISLLPVLYVQLQTYTCLCLADNKLVVKLYMELLEMHHRDFSGQWNHRRRCMSCSGHRAVLWEYCSACRAVKRTQCRGNTPVHVVQSVVDTTQSCENIAYDAFRAVYASYELALHIYCTTEALIMLLRQIIMTFVPNAACALSALRNLGQGRTSRQNIAINLFFNDVYSHFNVLAVRHQLLRDNLFHKQHSYSGLT